MDGDAIEQPGPASAARRYDPESVHAHLRSAADRLDDRPAAAVERAARDALTKLDALHAELERLLGGLHSTAESLAGALEALGAEPVPFEIPPVPPADYAAR
jgi:hypothetical protein